MAVKLKDLREGSIVFVRPDFGMAPPRKARVLCAEADIKNGRPGIDYEWLDGSDSAWAYLHQVDRVAQY